MELKDPDNISKQAEINPTSMFQQTALPYVEVLNTRFILEHGKSYVVVGQPVIESPLLTYFDVYEDTGKRADQETGRMVYTYMSKILTATYLESLLSCLDKTNQTDLNLAHKELESLLSTRDRQAGMKLYQHSASVFDLFNTLNEETVKIIQAEHVVVDDLEPFQEAWSAFWDVYEQRLDALFLIHEQIIKQKQILNIEGTPLEPIYREAEIMFELFAESIPTTKPILQDIDDLITLHWELGRTEPPGLTKKLLTPFELFSNRLFKHASRWSLWLLLPLLLILAVTDVVTFQPLIYAVFIVIVLYYAHSADTINIRANLMKRLKDHRQAQIEQQPIIQQKYSTIFQAFQGDMKQQEIIEEPDEFMTILARPGRWMLGFGVAILILGWGLLSGDTDSHDYGYGYIAVGTTLVIIRILLPYWAIVQRKFQLDRDKLVIGKRKHYIEHISYIKMKRNNKIIKMYTTQSTQEMIFRVKKEDRTEAAKKLKQWCILHKVRLET